MKQIIQSDKVRKAALLAIDNLVEPDMYEYELLLNSNKLLDRDIEHYINATENEWRELSLHKRFTTGRKAFAVKVLSDVYEDLFIDKKSCRIYLEYKIMGNWVNRISSTGFRLKTDVAKIEIDLHNDKLNKLTALTKAHGQVILCADEIELIEEWL